MKANAFKSSICHSYDDRLRNSHRMRLIQKVEGGVARFKRPDDLGRDGRIHQEIIRGAVPPSDPRASRAEPVYSKPAAPR